MENVFMTTTERKRMSTKTTFKRIALVAVAALGLGVLSVAPSQAALVSHTLTIDAAADSVSLNETATAVLTNVFTASVASDSTTIRYTCSTAVGSTCPTPTFYQTPTADTSNVMAHGFAGGEDTGTVYANSTWTDSAVVTTAPARSVVNVKAAGFSTTGTFTYTFYTTTSGAAFLTSAPSITWTVTVAAMNTTATTATVYLSSDVMTAYNGVTHWYAGSDSAIVADRGAASSVAIVGYAFVSPKNSAGETFVTNANGTRYTVDDSVTVSVSGPGYVSNHASAPTTAGNYSKSVVLHVKQHGEGAAATSTETLTVLNDGTAGTMTLTFQNKAGTVVATKTVNFSGNIASFSQVYVANNETTVTYDGAYGETATVYVYAKDSAGNLVVNAGAGRSVYLYSSDTAVAGNINGASLATGRVGSICSGPTATGLWTCTADIKDSGTVTLTVRDSSTVALSTLSSEIVFTITGATLKTATATFDKATYTPGERAVITITGKDTQGRILSGIGMNSKAYASAFSYVNTSALGATASAVNPYCGTVGVSGTGCASVTTTTFTPYKETSVETRVVTMPTTAGAVSYEFRDSAGLVIATLSATVVDPTKDAADAATDAALEATDAAYAAQDAAQLAAEAADAATAAAEAATAAVEDLATQVASLFADLQKQITTLANVVAKIAKKVKA